MRSRMLNMQCGTLCHRNLPVANYVSVIGVARGKLHDVLTVVQLLLDIVIDENARKPPSQDENKDATNAALTSASASASEAQSAVPYEVVSSLKSFDEYCSKVMEVSKLMSADIFTVCGGGG